MIQNERQYEVARKKLEDLKRSLDEAKDEAKTNPRSDLPEVIQQAGLNGIEMLMQDLQTEMAEYEKLRDQGTRTISLSSVFDDLPTALVQARIARGWSHRDLAQALGTTEQQVQKDESGGYARASLQRLHRVASALELEIQGRVKLQVKAKRLTVRRTKLAAKGLPAKVRSRRRQTP